MDKGHAQPRTSVNESIGKPVETNEPQIVGQHSPKPPSHQVSGLPNFEALLDRLDPERCPDVDGFLRKLHLIEAKATASW